LRLLIDAGDRMGADGKNPADDLELPEMLI
jgi:hypothetical protein